MMPGSRKSNGLVRSLMVGLGVAIALAAAACTTKADTGLTPTTIPDSVATTAAPPSVPVDAPTTTIVDESFAVDGSSSIWESAEFQTFGGFWLVPYSTLVVRVSDPNQTDPVIGDPEGDMWTFAIFDVVLGTYEADTIDVAGVFETGSDFDEAILFLIPHPMSKGTPSPEKWVVLYDDAGIVIADLDVWQEALAMADGALGLMVDLTDGITENHQMAAAAVLRPVYDLYGRMPLSTEPELFDTASGEPHAHSDEEGTATSQDQADTPLLVELEDRTIVFSNWFFMLLDGTATVTVLGPDGELLLEGPVEGSNAVMREVGTNGGDFEFFDGDAIVAFMTQADLSAAIDAALAE